MVSAVISLLVVYVYSTLKQPNAQGAISDAGEPYPGPQGQGEPVYVDQMNREVDLDEIQHSNSLSGYRTSDGAGRHLLTVNPDRHRDSLLGVGDGDDGDDDDDNCTKPRHAHAGFNDSCDFVRQRCQGEMQLINYLTFVTCDLKHIQVRR